jgi:8-oxo-dGTP diphosphatase
MPPESLKRLKTAEVEKISHIDYFNIAISVDCVIFGFEKKELKVLMIKSDLNEFAGKWSLLGDLVKVDEDLDRAPYRVLKQRTGLDDVFLQQVGSFGSINRHPSGRVITTAYYSLINIRNHKLKITDNEAQWHSLKNLKDLAFDHKQILEACLQRLRLQVMDEPVIFNLLPEKFSLRELQNLYQAILGVKLDRRNFRKKISMKNWLEVLDEMETGVPHRPGKLYKLKTDIHSIKRAKRKNSGF